MNFFRKRRKTNPNRARVLVSRPSGRRRGNYAMNTATDYGRAVTGFAGRIRKAVSRLSW